MYHGWIRNFNPEAQMNLPPYELVGEPLIYFGLKIFENKKVNANIHIIGIPCKM